MTRLGNEIGDACRMLPAQVRRVGGVLLHSFCEPMPPCGRNAPRSGAHRIVTATNMRRMQEHNHLATDLDRTLLSGATRVQGCQPRSTRPCRTHLQLA